MNRTSLVLVIVSALGAGPAAAQQELQSAHFLVGNWSCTHKVGDFAGTYTTTFESALGGAWIKQVYDFPATKQGAAMHAEYFLGYDARVGRWVRFGAHNNAMYFGMVGKRAGSVWSWSYVLPGTSGSAEWTRQSDTAYTVDGPSYPDNGKMVTEHHACWKVS